MPLSFYHYSIYNMIYRVKNIQEKSQTVPTGFKSWLEYWEKSVGETAEKCQALGCTELAVDGAHVKRENEDERWWIVPLCHQCNCQFGDKLFVEGPLVNVVDPKTILL